ncbi:MAG: hypothetical protein HWE20_05590 [Gammaproteobacteria bacterium]|nr:hypothetical protein [Gammaproteobacteria bacterium]
MSRLLLIYCFVVATANSLAAELRLAYAYSPRTLDPHVETTAAETHISHLIFDSIAPIDPYDRSNRKGLVDSVNRIDDFNWEFTLRDDIVFHNGDPVRAVDAVYSIKRAMRVGNSGLFKALAQTITQLSVVSDHVFRATTTTRDDLYAQLALIKVIPASLLHPDDPEAFSQGSTIIGSGPFKFGAMKDNQLQLLRNDHYRRHPAYWQTLVIQFIADEEARIEALLDGRVDVAEQLSYSSQARLIDSGIRTFSRATKNIYFLMLDTYSERAISAFDASGKRLERNPFKDIRVRQAINIVLDRQAIARQFPGGGGTPAGQIFRPDWYEASPNLSVPIRDVERARELIQLAGYGDGFVLVVPDNGTWTSGINLELKRQLAVLGIDVKLSHLDRKNYMPKLGENHYSLMIFGWGPTKGSPEYTFDPLFISKDQAGSTGSYNYGRYQNPQLETLVNKAKLTNDKAQQLQLYRLSSEVLINDLGTIPLFYPNTMWGFDKRLRYALPKTSWETKPELFFPVEY